jgi:hypothetical protein
MAAAQKPAYRLGSNEVRVPQWTHERFRRNIMGYGQGVNENGSAPAGVRRMARKRTKARMGTGEAG